MTEPEDEKRPAPDQSARAQFVAAETQEEKASTEGKDAARTRAHKPSDDLLPLIAAGYQLIPLYSPEELDVHGRSLGKHPRDKKWTTADYSGFHAVAHMDAGGNVGVRLSDDDLVVDVDPRNFAKGADALAKLEADIGATIRSAPCVVTGSGGFHFYLKKPTDWPTVSGLSDYQGIDFKSRGAQVVAPGSMHPNGKRYEWGFGPEPTDSTAAPQALLDIVRRRPKQRSSAEPALITDEELAGLLKTLPVMEFEVYGAWLRLMMASHHATGGEGLDAFADWSTSDPKHAGARADIEYKWRGLSDGGGITYHTLFDEVHRRQRPGEPDATFAFRQREAVRDFENEPLPDDFDVDDERPRIRVVPGQLSSVIDQAQKALIEAGENIFVRGSDLVRFSRVGVDGALDDVKRSDDALVLRPVSDLWLRERMSRAAIWYGNPVGRPKDGEAPKAKRIDPPQSIANHLLEREGEWHFRRIRAVVHTPTLTAKGELVQEPGYDAASRLYLDLAPGQFDRVPESPSHEDAKAALAVLGKPIRAFPFVSGASRSVALSAMLTGLIRPSLESAPMHAFDAPAAGTGKSLLVDVVSIITTGTTKAAMSIGANAEETDKRLASALMAGDQMLLLDNVQRPVEGELLCSMLTQSTVQTRVLGKSHVVTLPSTCLLTVTGNNIRFTSDVSRRVVICRMDAQVERPDQREFDFSPKADALRDRGKLVVAGLTVLKAYFSAGRPLAGKLRPMGSFDDWSLVREALVWVGEADPADTVDAAVSQDPEIEQLKQVLSLWHEAYGEGAVTVNRLGDAGFDETPAASLKKLLTEAFCEGRGWSGPRVGGALDRYKERIAGGFKLVEAGAMRAGKAWKVVSTSAF